MEQPTGQWTAIDKLRHKLEKEEEIKLFKEELALACGDGLQTNVPASPAWMKADGSIDKDEVLKVIEAKMLEIIESIGRGEAPVLYHSNRRLWSNVQFSAKQGLGLTPDHSLSAIRFDSIASVNKFSLTVKVLSLIHELVQRGTFSTKRDLYYQAPQLFGSQAAVDGIIDNISCMLAIPRWGINVLATSKGSVAGDLRYVEHDGTHVDCRSASGATVPTHVTAMRNIQSGAKFVLIVEKDATFQTLLDDAICERLNPCIIITGKGFPDVNTRMLVKKLWETLKIPTLALVDADPHGIEIACVYKFGSLTMSFESSNLTVPTIRWLGLLPSDIDRLAIPQSALLDLTQADRSKGEELLKRPYIASLPAWKRELSVVLGGGKKAELQALGAISPSFMSEVYLPSKIKYGGWI